MSTENSTHRVAGMGAAHSGTQHFWRQRVTAVALIVLSAWFVVAVLKLVGAGETDVLTFFQHPLNAILMGSFVLVTLIHMQIGMQSVIDDYATSDGQKVAFLLLNRAFTWSVGAACLLALLRMAI
jgi:succinate dehydrogenase / fumarate reductase, membrane anchor subunit